MITRATNTRNTRNRILYKVVFVCFVCSCVSWRSSATVSAEVLDRVLAVVGGQLIISVRNLGYSRNAGEFVKAYFADIGSAGGHRSMAKAVMPIEQFRGKFGDLSGVGIAGRIGELAEEFLSEPAADKKIPAKSLD